ncbi:hypothetical protein [Pseudoduganella danionis]|uniref:hypothetical protein n=1 Tax=Pseudoduganella danionis TaxID=1890295 RepID=UPI0035B00523
MATHQKLAELLRKRCTEWSFDTYSALPAQGKLSAASLDHVPQLLEKRGKLVTILDRYRPARTSPKETH